jgi:hypothetical protein
MHAQHEDDCFRTVLQDGLRGCESIHARQCAVHHDNVRNGALNGRNRFGSVADVSHDFNVGLIVE